MEFEEIFSHIGQFGTYQLLVFLVVMYIAMFHGYQATGMIFLGLEQEYFCKVNELQHLPYDKQQDIAIPGDGNGEYSKCEVFNLPWATYNKSDFLTWDREIMTSNASTMRCQHWNYYRDIFANTIVTQFELTCGRGWYIQLPSTCYLAGMLVGSFACGLISDRFGRLKTMVGSAFLYPFVGLGLTYSPNIEVFCFVRFLLGIVAFSAFLSGFVYVTETVGPKYRTYASVSYNTMFAVGNIVHVGEAYFVRDYQNLLLVMVIPAFFTLSYIWILPESARWLHAHGSSEKTLQTLQLIADVNRKQLPQNLHFVNADSRPKQKGNVFDLFRYPYLRKITLISFFNWFTNSLLFFGLSLNVGSLVGNVFLNAFLMSFVEIPGNTMSAFVAERFGRRQALFASFLATGLCNMALIPLIITEEVDWLLIVFTVLGKAGSGAAFATTFLMTAELFPTQIRQVAMGSCSVVSRISGMLAPYVGGPLVNVWKPLPSLIFGSFGLASAVLVLFLHETLNHPMPDTIEDVENIRIRAANSTKLKHASTSQAELTSSIENISINPAGEGVQEYETYENVMKTAL